MTPSLAPVIGLVVAPLAALFVAATTGNGTGSDGRRRAAAVGAVTYAGFLLPLAFGSGIETAYRGLFVGDTVIWRTPWERQFSHALAGVGVASLVVAAAVMIDRVGGR